MMRVGVNGMEFDPLRFLGGGGDGVGDSDAELDWSLLALAGVWKRVAWRLAFLAWVVACLKRRLVTVGCLLVGW
jgi:hypothetical protein